MNRTAPTRLDLRRHLEAMRTYRQPGWLRDSLDPDLCAAALSARIGDLVPEALAVRSVRVTDARARTRRWTLRYEADVVTRRGDRTVLLVAERYPPEAPPPADDAAVVLPELQLNVRAVPADHGLPALTALTDPAAARALLERVLRGRTRPDLCLVGARARLARHKPGNRATLVYDLAYAPGADPQWPRTVVAKTYRGDEGADTFVAMQALWAKGPTGRGAPRLAEPLAYLPEPRVLLQGPVPGDRTLSDAVRQAATATDGAVTGVEPALVRAAYALAALHACPVHVGPERDVSTELAAVRRLLTRLAATVPAESMQAADGLLTELARRAERDPAPPPGPVHGAFRPAQVLLAGTQPGFVDFDGFGLGEPALDLGRFVARLGELWRIAAPVDASDPHRQRGLADGFIEAYRERVDVSVHRVAIWQCLDLVGGVVRGWTRAQPARADVLLDLLDSCLPQVR